MTRPRLFALCIAVMLLSATVTSAQDLSRYRDYQLGMTLAAVAKQAGMKPSDARVLHQRPELIEELEWRSQDESGFPAERDTVQEDSLQLPWRPAVPDRGQLHLGSHRGHDGRRHDRGDLGKVWTGDAACDRVRRVRSRARHHRRQGCRPLGRFSVLPRSVAPVFRIDVRHDPALEAVGCHGARGRREDDPKRRSDPRRGSHPNGPTRGSDTGDRAPADPGSRARRQTGDGQASEQSIVSALRGARPEAWACEGGQSLPRAISRISLTTSTTGNPRSRIPTGTRRTMPRTAATAARASRTVLIVLRRRPFTIE